MAYIKQTWQNNPPSATTPISAARLDHLETQYDEAISTLEPTVTEVNSGRLSEEVLEARTADIARSTIGGEVTVYGSVVASEDGVTDDGPAINAAISSAVTPGGIVRYVRTPGRPCHINTGIDILAPGSSVKFISTGAPPITLGPDTTTGLTVRGSISQLTGGDDAYNATSVGDTTITTRTDLTGSVSPGDWLMIWSSDADNEERPTQYMSGEMAVADQVTSTLISLDRPIQLVHSPGALRRIYLMNPTLSPEILDLGVSFSESDARQVGVQVEYAINALATNVRAQGKNGRYGLRFNQVVDGRIDSPRVTDMWDATEGSAPNAIAVLLNGCNSVEVNQAFGSRTRHVVDVNSYSSPGLPGIVSRENVINRLKGVKTYGPPASTHHARGTVFNGVEAINCGGGIHNRGVSTTIRDFRPVGGSTAKPAEWNATRFLPSGIAIGETDSLPAGEGPAGTDLIIENYDPRALRSDWSAFSWSDRLGPGTRISGPSFVDVPGVVVSDSADRPDGEVGLADLRMGGIIGLSANWAWQQNLAGVRIVGGEFARPTGGTTGHGMRTPVSVPENVEVSAVWDQIGTPGTMNCLFSRGSNDNTLTFGYFLGVSSDGSVTLGRRVSGSSTNMVSASAGSVVNGDLVTLRTIGRNISALVNGELVVSTSDSSVTSPGTAGFWFRNPGNEGWAASNFRVFDTGFGSA